MTSLHVFFGFSIREMLHFVSLLSLFLCTEILFKGILKCLAHFRNTVHCLQQLWLTSRRNLVMDMSSFFLQVWTPNVITVWEALLTVLMYGLLLTHAYAQDKCWPYISLPLYALLLLFFPLSRFLVPLCL